MLQLGLTGTNSVVRAALSFITFVSLVTPVYAQGRIDQAKKEGKIGYYTTMNMSETSKLIKPFRKKYPFLKVNIFRTGDEAMLTKIETEARLGRHLWDVLAITGFTGYYLYSKGFFAKYNSPERKFFPSGSKDKEGYWTSSYSNSHIVVYNTNLVPKNQAPKSWQDLLDPKWKGKLALDAKDYEWFANMLAFMGKEKGLAYMKRLAAQDLRIQRGHTLLTQLVAAGEMSVGIAMYGHRVEQMKKRGAPLEWAGLNPVVLNLHPLALSAHAPHRNAGTLLIDYLLSKEAAKVIQSVSRIPDRVDVPPDPPSLVKGVPILASDLSLVKDYNRYVKLYRKIFNVH
ncbi:MAG: ABC transporter substrate-binding protein [Candidatus Binatia bacterium]